MRITPSGCGGLLSAATCVLAALVVCAATTVGQENHKRVLLLFDEDKTLPGLAALDHSLRSTFSAGFNGEIEFFSESMNLSQFNGEHYDDELGSYYFKKYRDRRPDLIVAVMGPSLAFLLRHGDAVFPGVPIVFCGVDPEEIRNVQLSALITGVFVRREFAPTLDIAFKLQPQTKNVFVVAGTSTFDRHLLAKAQQEFQPFESRVHFVYLTDLSMRDLLTAVSHLPPQSVIVYVSMFRDAAGQSFVPHDVASRISGVANAPVYVFVDQYLGQGPVGGYLYSLKLHGQNTAEIGLRILSGESPAAIPSREPRDSSNMFDRLALQRWGLRESDLPPGSIVFNRRPSFWQLYKQYVLAGILVLLAQTVAILGLLWQRARKRKAEAILRNSEERFRLAAAAGNMFAYEWNAATDVIQRSPEFVKVLGFDGTAQTTGQQILAHVHAEDRERVMAALAGLSPEKPDLRSSFRMVRADGTTIWVERSSRAEFNKQGKLLRTVGMVADITARKHAEELLQESEERFRLVATTAPVMIWMSGPDKLCTYFNQPWLTFTGRSIHDELGNGWAEGVHAEDLERCLETYKRAFDQREPFDMEYRLRRHDGEYRWIFDYGVPRFNADGSFAGYIGSASDVSDQKLAQEALEKVSGQLIEAQERERRRLARELHDDICQRLSMVSLKIEKAMRATSKGDVSAADQLEQIWQQCSNLTGDVQALSHELHPSILDNLGLVTAVRSFCREVSEHSGVVVEFDSSEVPASLPSEVSLSLFRVVQEALRNAVKYSGQKHFEVRLQGVSGDLELQVRDEGVGFDAANTMSRGGLGLVSMAERIHQVNGTFTIDSHPKAGTRIHARVPLTAQKVKAASAS